MGITFKRGITVTVAALVMMGLAACDENGGFDLKGKPDVKVEDDGAPEAKAAPRRTVGKDVEAPDVFSANEEGLWDGRPSLGGIWVAHPDVAEPERVVIRNPSNGRSVTGALFRRERDLPGPTLQVSSDAAAELGLVAGEPQKLNVTALRREKPPEKTDTPAETAETGTPEEATRSTQNPILPGAARSPVSD